ncbi:MAG: hypothetical protein ACRDX8_00485 [Acidimicrobiales bacterium]
MRPLDLRQGLGGAAALVAALLVVGCSVGPSAVKISPGHAVRAPTAITLQSSWAASGSLGAPLAVSCSGGGRAVSVRGAFGPETVDIELRGLHPGKHYTFMQFADPPPSATVTLTESGPVVDYYSVKVKPPKDFLGPRQGLEDQGSGTLSVSQRGKSGSLKVTLPKDDSISGHWTCGTRQRTGPASRPALYPATVPPVVNECAIGTLNGPTPPPISCPNGDLNVNAWGDSANLSGAGRSASLAKVEADICSDYRAFFKGGAASVAVSIALEYSIAALYYGWRFSPTPAQVVTDAGCVS